MRWIPVTVCATSALALAVASPIAAGRAQGEADPPKPATARGSADLAEFWVDPGRDRDLYYGVGGQALAPNPSALYTVVKEKQGGFSDGYTVKDPSGRTWSAKLYPEGRTEVVASRLVWGLGYQQPPVYAVESWQAEGAVSPNPQPVARFREQMPDFHGLKEVGSWAYDDNPFVGTRQMNGLLVLQVMLTNADLKPQQNMIYDLAEPAFGARRWWVARDLGQSFGRSGVLEATRDDIDSYDQTRFITGVENGHVTFEYYGRQSSLLKSITPQDVRWICERVSLLSDRQLLDAFRAGGYADSTAQRFIRRLKLKVAEGLSLHG